MKGLATAPHRDVDLLALDEALERLTKVDPQRSRIVELRFFGGLSNEESAEVLGRFASYDSTAMGGGKSVALSRAKRFRGRMICRSPGFKFATSWMRSCKFPPKIAPATSTAPVPSRKCVVTLNSLIISYEKADEFLATARRWICIPSHGIEAESPPPWVGRRIGAYLIEKEIGEGGMGTVFQAVRADDEYQKRVAIKLVKGGFASRSRDSAIQGRTPDPGRPRTSQHRSIAGRWPHRRRISLPGHGVRRWRAH